MTENQEKSDVLEWSSGAKQVGYRNAAISDLASIAINIGDFRCHTGCVLEAGIKDSNSCIILLDWIFCIVRRLNLVEVCGLDGVLDNRNVV